MAGAASPQGEQKVELVTMNGDLLTTFDREDFDELTVAELIEDLEQDMVQGIEGGARADDLGVFIERFRLAIGCQILQPYDYFEDIFPTKETQGRQAIRINLIKEPVPEATYKQIRESAEAEDMLRWRWRPLSFLSWNASFGKLPQAAGCHS